MSQCVCTSQQDANPYLKGSFTVVRHSSCYVKHVSKLSQSLRRVYLFTYNMIPRHIVEDGCTVKLVNCIEKCGNIWGNFTSRRRLCGWFIFFIWWKAEMTKKKKDQGRDFGLMPIYYSCQSVNFLKNMSWLQILFLFYISNKTQHTNSQYRGQHYRLLCYNWFLMLSYWSQVVKWNNSNSFRWAGHLEGSAVMWSILFVHVKISAFKVNCAGCGVNMVL